MYCGITETFSSGCPTYLPHFWSQFVRHLDTAANQIKRAKIKSQTRRELFLDSSKKECFKLCFKNEGVIKGDVALVNKNASLVTENRALQSNLRRLEKGPDKIAYLKRLVIDQRSKIDRLKCSLAIANRVVKKYRRLNMKPNPCHDYSVKMKRYFRQNAIKDLNLAPEENSMRLLSATLIPPCSDRPITYSFTDQKPVKAIGPDLATKMLDDAQVSLRQYSRMYSRLKNIFPTPYAVRLTRGEHAKIIPATETQFEKKSVATVDYGTLLTEKIRSLVSLSKINNINSNLRVKISGDGTKVGNNVKLVTFCFLILKPGSTCQSDSDVCNIVLARCREEYSDATTVFGPTLQQIEVIGEKLIIPDSSMTFHKSYGNLSVITAVAGCYG